LVISVFGDDEVQRNEVMKSNKDATSIEESDVRDRMENKGS
jgi:hypothetical protein